MVPVLLPMPSKACESSGPKFSTGRANVDNVLDRQQQTANGSDCRQFDDMSSMAHACGDAIDDAWPQDNFAISV